MGAGIDPKVLRRRMYCRLKTIERQLTRRGIECHYMGDLEVKGKNFTVYYSGIGPASNAESFHWLVLRFNPEHQPTGCRKHAGDVDYSNFHTGSVGDFEAGVKRVLESLAVATRTSKQLL